MNNYAEQNRQLLRRYTPEQCILFELPDHIFAALQAGTPITWRHYFPKGSRTFSYSLSGVIWFSIAILVLGVLAALANVNAENPTDPALIALGTLALLLAFNGFMVFMFFASVSPRVRKLNALWQHGKLLVSRQVEIGKPKDIDAQHGLRYTFETPDGVLSREKDHYAPIEERAKAQPITLMLYRSPQEYFIL